ncbi:Protein ALP1-like [Frankliniella fusca]|uniref:Protein ALP1-like n=1 Tax=Frankliniella fusca TaxID=407009 RepID=A0AAE1HZ92_9NEOP|nr:Protein ALP1-like [Frankliniella fusca]
MNPVDMEPATMIPITYEMCSQGSAEDFRYFTGLTIGQFLVVYQLIGGDEVCNQLKYNLNGTTPVRKNALKISLKSRLFLVLLKMRRDLSLRDIGKIMGISKSQAGAIFFTWIRLLAVSFKELESDLAVSAKKQNRLKPPCFKPYRNLRMIVDCAEFVIEKSDNMQQLGNTYSNYKHRNTCKVLFGVSCYGGVSYVSGGYEGRITDQEIVMQSGFLDILEEGDAIMADRGFLLEEEMAQKGVKLIKPPNMTRKSKNRKSKKEFTAREEVATKSVAAVRIYVEHVIGKVRNFQILDNKVELLSLPILPDMIFVASCLHNFTKCYIGKKPLADATEQSKD